ncbi:alpha/beta hydrolase [Hahella sp. CCB-MM4]|uniref:alpha/beta fold hydrolase n=1 Tax=Hahella sp. (strain CCB-MM4) TaxID=1926491 RepID=UPI000B9ADAB7|nr:alpha/beta hydrolase [Hahella sp. CCB-MM4]OZG73671.1 alpha/beta hydrolase [Hahella sp. CCB-MM4]
MKEVTLQLPDIKLGGIRWGEGNPTKVLALHGWLDNAATYTFLAPLLVEAGLDLVAVDLAGHGNSQHRAAGGFYHLVDYIKEVGQAIEALEWKRPILLGHSLGAVISSLYASAAGETISRLILMEALGPMADPPEKTSENLKRALQRAMKPSSQKRPYYTIEKAVEDRSRGFGGLSLLASEALVQRNLTVDKQGWVWKTDSRLRWPSFVRFTEPQVENYLSSINLPTLLVAASNGIISLDPEKNSRLSFLSNVKKVLVEGGHHMHMDGDVVTLAEEIISFIRE